LWQKFFSLEIALETFGLGRDNIRVDLAEFEKITLEAVGKVAPKLRFK
jgi:hypothetical protein